MAWAGVRAGGGGRGRARISGYNALFYRHRLAQQAKECLGVEHRIDYRVVEQAVERVLVLQHGMLNHLGVAREELLLRQGVEEAGRYYYGIGVCECAYFIFQAIEIHAGLAAYGRVDGAQQGSGDIDEAYAAFECGGSETAKVGHHAAAYIYKYRTAGGSEV